MLLASLGGGCWRGRIGRPKTRGAVHGMSRSSVKVLRAKFETMPSKGYGFVRSDYAVEVRVKWV